MAFCFLLLLLRVLAVDTMDFMLDTLLYEKLERC